MAPWPPDPTVVTDDYIGALPFQEAQSIFSASDVLSGTLRYASCGWHGTKFHPALGSFGVVKTDGPLSDLVGERIRVGYGSNAVWVYLTDEGDCLEDLSLTRRCFMAIAPAALDVIRVTTQVAP